MTVNGPQVIAHAHANSALSTSQHDAGHVLKFFCPPHPMKTMAIESRIASPTNSQDADLIVSYVCENLSRNYDTVKASLPTWDQQGCHLFAQALKSCYQFDHGHLLGQALRNLANAAILREHRLAAKA